MKHILIVEDDKALSNGIAFALKKEDINVFQCFDIKHAQEVKRDRQIDLVILDVNLPDGNGLELLCEMKAVSDTPVIMLTANDMETDIVVGLEMGADDYITKPFSLAILRARVNTQLRKELVKYNTYKQEAFMFDFDKMMFYKKNMPIELSKTEQKLLRLLVENRGYTMERSKLVDRIWTDGAEYVDENALSVTIKRLRDKLEDTPSKPSYIKTVYGIGYTWVVENECV